MPSSNTHPTDQQFRGYTRANGTYVSPHQQKVHVANWHAEAKSGANPSEESWIAFSALDTEEQVRRLQALAQEMPDISHLDPAPQQEHLAGGEVELTEEEKDEARTIARMLYQNVGLSRADLLTNSLPVRLNAAQRLVDNVGWEPERALQETTFIGVDFVDGDTLNFNEEIYAVENEDWVLENPGDPELAGGEIDARLDASHLAEMTPARLENINAIVHRLGVEELALRASDLARLTQQSRFMIAEKLVTEHGWRPERALDDLLATREFERGSSVPFMGKDYTLVNGNWQEDAATTESAIVHQLAVEDIPLADSTLIQMTQPSRFRIAEQLVRNHNWNPQRALDCLTYDREFERGVNVPFMGKDYHLVNGSWRAVRQAAAPSDTHGWEEGDERTSAEGTFVFHDGAWVRSVSADAEEPDWIPPAHDELEETDADVIARRMFDVPYPQDRLDALSFSETNNGVRRRMKLLAALVAAGDHAGVVNFSTSRSRANYRIIDDYRNALLDAAAGGGHPDVAPVHAGAAVPEPPVLSGNLSGNSPEVPMPDTAEPASSPASNLTGNLSGNSAEPTDVPMPPTLSGANMTNPALVSAQRRINALYVAARSADPVNELTGIRTSRGNGYLNRADDYRTALLAHFNALPSGTAINDNIPVTHAEAPAHEQPAPSAMPTVPPEQNPIYVANPFGKTVAELGFFPRPNVSLNTTVGINGFRPSGMAEIPWPNALFKALAKRYLEQPTALQTQAKQYQGLHTAKLAPMHPDLVKIQAQARADGAAYQERRRLIQEEEARQAAAQRVRDEAAKAVQRRADMKRCRVASKHFIDHIRDEPELATQQVLGANIKSYPDNLDAGLAIGLNEAATKLLAQTIICDIDKVSKWNVKLGTYSRAESHGDLIVRGNPDNGKALSLRFTSDTGITLERVMWIEGGKMYCDHSYFNQPDNMTNHGLAKNAFRGSMAAYKTLGVQKIFVHANLSVGGYSWFKYGMKINKSSWDSLRNGLKGRLSRLVLPEPVRDNIKTLLASPDPLSGFVLSDFMDGERKVGNELLLGSNWYGQLDLNDDFCMRRCLAYIKRRV